MSKNLTKKINIDWVYFWIGLIVSLIAIWETTHNITNWPKYNIVIEPGSQAAKYEESSNISRFLGNASPFFYFTTLSNYIFGFTTFIRAFYKKGVFSYNLQIAACTYMTITGIIFWTTISYIIPWEDVLFCFEQVFIHLVHPILSWVIIIFFLKKEPKVKHIRSILSIIRMSIFPLIYYIAVWIFYISIGGKATIYPFLNFYHPFLINFHWVVILWMDQTIFVILLTIFILVHLSIIWILSKKKIIKLV